MFSLPQAVFSLLPEVFSLLPGVHQRPHCWEHSGGPCLSLHANNVARPNTLMCLVALASQTPKHPQQVQLVTLVQAPAGLASTLAADLEEQGSQERWLRLIRPHYTESG